jgi:hypothetical protein
MFKFLTRIVLFVVGVALLADIGLPTITENLHVDQHTSSTERCDLRDRNNTCADTSYTLHFVGGHPLSCSVGYSAYGKVKDGDSVLVQATRLFKNCIRISRGQELITDDNHWKLFQLIGGLLLLAAAVGWINTEDGEVRFW